MSALPLALLRIARSASIAGPACVATSHLGSISAIAASAPNPASACQIRSLSAATAAATPYGNTLNGSTRSFSSAGGEYYSRIIYPEADAFVGKPAPEFTAGAVVDGEIKQVSLSDYKGKYVVLFFYPKDFTFVCPTEIIAFSDRAKEFEALGCQVLAASTDTEECHLAWIKTPRNRGGLGYMQIPIIADVTKEISALYGVLIEKIGIANRGLFIINPEGIIQQITINDLPIGRSVDETLRLLQAIQYVAKHGEVCPANWKPGEATMVADPDKSLDYFSTLTEGATEGAIAGKLEPVKDAQHFKDLVAGSSKRPLVVDFYAPWCGKCRQIGPFLDGLTETYPGVTFAKFDTTQANLESLAGELGVKALPAFRFFKGGKEVGEPITGYKKKLLEDAVAKLGA